MIYFSRQRECTFECMADVQKKICGCLELNSFIYFHKKALPETMFCTPKQAYECMLRNPKLNVTAAVEQCFNHGVCPERCELWQYCRLSKISIHVKLSDFPFGHMPTFERALWATNTLQASNVKF